MASNPTEHFINLLNLLTQEKDEDLAQYQQKMQSTSFKERRANGVLWHPCTLVESKFDAGERLIIQVSKPKEHQYSHSFSNGKLVEVFSISDETQSLKGVVNKVKDDFMYITINADDFPNWIAYNKIGVQLLFDDRSYREMQWALNELIKTESKRLVELQKKILGYEKPYFLEEKYTGVSALNKSQQKAVEKVLGAQDFAIIHGPPGTGKTTTLVEAIKETLKRESQVLVCAPSNAAVDLLTEKLTQQGISVVRIGHPARIDDEILNQTLESKIAQHQDFKLLKDLRKRAEEYFKLGGKWKRNFGQSEREQRKMLLAEARSLKKDAERTHDEIVDDVLFSTRVIACTLVGANHPKLKELKFSTCFIDEAGQALEPASWIPIIKSNKVVFAGDHLQLPPTVKSYEAGEKGLKETLFEKAIKVNQADVLLNEQYRMNEDIMNFSSRVFYKGILKANEHNAHLKVFPNDQPVEFLDTAGTGFFEAQHPETRSSFNQEEAKLIFKHLNNYKEEVLGIGYDLPQSIGIISPYKAQVELITQMLDESDWEPNFKRKITINTVDGFQGQERDMIYISLVRSNETGEIGFLSDERRMNVALTRAKRKLVVIGDSATIASKSKFYNEFLDYINEVEAYRSAFELIY